MNVCVRMFIHWLFSKAFVATKRLGALLILVKIGHHDLSVTLFPSKSSV